MRSSVDRFGDGKAALLLCKDHSFYTCETERMNKYVGETDLTYLNRFVKCCNCYSIS